MQRRICGRAESFGHEMHPQTGAFYVGDFDGGIDGAQGSWKRRNLIYIWHGLVVRWLCVGVVGR